MSDTKTALLKEAEILIRSRGYSGFSYADLSAVVGVTKATIHHHYATKELLAAAALEAYTARYAEGLEKIEADVPNALDRIEAYGRLYTDGINRGLGCLCAALAADLDVLPIALRAGTMAFFKSHLIWLERVYEKGLDLGELSIDLNPAEAARLIVATMEGSLLVERMLSKQHGFELSLAALRKSLSP